MITGLAVVGAVVITLIILMIRNEPPAFEPYEKETIDDFED